MLTEWEDHGFENPESKPGGTHRVSVEVLRALLEDPRLLPGDVLVPNAVENLAVYRNGVCVGFLELGPTKELVIFESRDEVARFKMGANDVAP